jgi:hypothetical protein
MGYIEEPIGVDLVIGGRKLTAEDRKAFSAFIRRQRALLKKQRSAPRSVKVVKAKVKSA